ncbi:MAG TPA: hypothetical protein DDX19_14495 [Rhodopirellula baltica]|uniref:Uncharacterized protein n=1 Tax=Rhodopirellula baltica (strain DSM 10527 / NCIMB 13988 / SH1) TaxID=243090 RepID=Q7UZ30_RHOBA|nr:hypothetical protein RB227 [Rhodopirellula baltica SH 1]HBE63915.1 hypothetical protein [Rhodopirellula baltica]
MKVVERIEKDAPHPNCRWSSRQIWLRQASEAPFSRVISPTIHPVAHPKRSPAGDFAQRV